MQNQNKNEATKQAMETSDAVIAILTRNSYSSSAVRSELEQVLFNDKFKGRFLPVMIGKKDEDFSRLPWVLSKINHLRLDESESKSSQSKKIVLGFSRHLKDQGA